MASPSQCKIPEGGVLGRNIRVVGAQQHSCPSLPDSRWAREESWSQTGLLCKLMLGLSQASAICRVVASCGRRLLGEAPCTPPLPQGPLALRGLPSTGPWPQLHLETQGCWEETLRPFYELECPLKPHGVRIIRWVLAFLYRTGSQGQPDHTLAPNHSVDSSVCRPPTTAYRSLLALPQLRISPYRAGSRAKQAEVDNPAALIPGRKSRWGGSIPWSQMPGSFVTIIFSGTEKTCYHSSDWGSQRVSPCGLLHQSLTKTWSATF